MKRKNNFRTVLILFFIALAIYYIYPSFILNSVEQEEQGKIAEISAISGLPESDVYQNIYRDDVDFMAEIEETGISGDDLARVEEIVTYLREVMNEKLIDIRSKAIKQGLDLQGGMHITLEVDMVRLLENIATKKDDKFYELQTRLRELVSASSEDFYALLSEVYRENNLPLNRYFGDMRDSEGDIIKLIKDEAADAVSRSQEILTNRVDQFGVSEPSIHRQGNHRIVVELPGVHDPSRARALIGKTALLEFKLLASDDKTQLILEEIDSYLKREIAGGLSIEGDTTEALEDMAAVTSADTMETAEADTTGPAPKESKDAVVDVNELFGAETVPLDGDTSLLVDSDLMQNNPFYTLLRNIQGNISVPKQNYRTVNRIIHRREIQNLMPSEYEFLWSNVAEVSPSDGNEYYTLYYIKREPELTGSALRDATVQISGGDGGGAAGQPIIAFELNRQGARAFARITGAHIGNQLAIVLDDKVHMAPNIKSKIPDGRGIIEGSFAMEEARDMAIVLRAGALPAPVNFVEERTVGPSLGQDSVNEGFTSAVAGLILVILFMLWYYRMGGIVADIALVLNMLFVMSILAGFQGTLTLPGIAGIILTIGMAVDANVLIYERIREELRTGKTVKAAVDAGYSRAIVTILDANITTLIAAVVLYQFGAGPIQGFALTLMIGIVASMFTAIVVTRAVFDWALNKFQVKTLKI